MAFNIRVPFVIASHIKKYAATSSLKNKNKAAAFGVVSNIPYFHDGTAARQIVDVNTAATLANKTLTSPAINGASISSPINDSNALARFIANATAKTIVDGSATGLFSVAVPAGPAGVGGAGFFLVRASDGTEIQAISGMFTYSAVAKTTTVIGTITYVTGNEAKAVSSGTLTLAFTADVSVASVVTFKLQPTGSLTETTPYTIEYSLFPVRGVVTIL